MTSLELLSVPVTTRTGRERLRVRVVRATARAWVVAWPLGRPATASAEERTLALPGLEAPTPRAVRAPVATFDRQTGDGRGAAWGWQLDATARDALDRRVRVVCVARSCRWGGYRSAGDVALGLRCPTCAGSDLEALPPRARRTAPKVRPPRP